MDQQGKIADMQWPRRWWWCATTGHVHHMDLRWNLYLGGNLSQFSEGLGGFVCTIKSDLSDVVAVLHSHCLIFSSLSPPVYRRSGTSTGLSGPTNIIHIQEIYAPPSGGIMPASLDNLSSRFRLTTFILSTFCRKFLQFLLVWPLKTQEQFPTHVLSDSPELSPAMSPFLSNYQPILTISGLLLFVSSVQVVEKVDR